MLYNGMPNRLHILSIALTIQCYALNSMAAPSITHYHYVQRIIGIYHSKTKEPIPSLDEILLSKAVAQTRDVRYIEAFMDILANDPDPLKRAEAVFPFYLFLEDFGVFTISYSFQDARRIVAQPDPRGFPYVSFLADRLFLEPVSAVRRTILSLFNGRYFKDLPKAQKEDVLDDLYHVYKDDADSLVKRTAAAKAAELAPEYIWLRDHSVLFDLKKRAYLCWRSLTSPLGPFERPYHY